MFTCICSYNYNVFTNEITVIILNNHKEKVLFDKFNEFNKFGPYRQANNHNHDQEVNRLSQLGEKSPKNLFAALVATEDEWEKRRNVINFENVQVFEPKNRCRDRNLYLQKSLSYVASILGDHILLKHRLQHKNE